MGYTSRRSLERLVERTRRNVPPALRDIADDGGTVMTRAVTQNTPVDTEQLRQSITKKPVTAGQLRDAGGRFMSGMSYESGTFTEVEYAPHVEHGTGLWGPKSAKYRIEPKDPNGVLAFYVKGSPTGLSSRRGGGTAEGTLVFAKYVLHPGSPGQHMFATGAAFTESRFDEIAAKGLNEWARKSERGT